MKQHLLKEIEVGTKNALLKKKIITHYIYNGAENGAMQPDGVTNICSKMGKMATWGLAGSGIMLMDILLI